jgi:dipeptidyl aminopeptidase/acylaminoacyl peptidase
MRIFRLKFLASMALCFATVAQAQFITPGANLVIEGIPPIEVALTKKVEAYTEFRPSSIVAWHPARTAMLIRTRPVGGNSAQLHLVEKPGDKPTVITDFPDAVSGASFQPKKGEYILFERGAGGNEVFRIYLMDLNTKEITAVSPDNERAASPSWNRKGDKIVFTTATIDRFNRGEGAARMAVTKLYIADPMKPSAAKLITTLDGGRWFNFRFSPNDKKLLFTEYISANESHIWQMDIATKKKTRITPQPKLGEVAVAYGAPRYTRDGKGLYVTTDRGSEYRRLIHLNLATGKETVLTGHLNFDVDDFAVSTAARRIAFLTNESGSSVLRFLDLESLKELPRPALLAGEISGLRWQSSNDDDSGEIGASKELAFNLTSAKSPGEVFSYDAISTKMVRWTNGAALGLNPQEFVDPQLVKWKSFDGLGISGFLYQPDAKKFAGKRPVIINIHGGPEGQARPGFIARNNYMVNEMGIAVLYPNVRGSSGFGKTFLAADNGFKREDSVKDIGALFDWIATQPDLDAARVLVMGGSYGGYMTLAVATNYPDKIAGGISSVGISNFVTFLTNTESYRRDLRRVEYGDERDPKMREFFDKISPLNNADKMKKPMMIVQGKNDPRVPYTESVQIVEQLKKQSTPVWFLMANDEGHGFAKKNNQDFLFYAQIKFMEKLLLP